MNVYVVKSLSSEGTLKDLAFCPSATDARQIKTFLETDEKFKNKILLVSTIPLTTYRDFAENELAQRKKEKIAADKKLAREMEKFRKKEKIKTE